jgi:adenylylsulfate kinase-like enzyme
VGLTVEVIRQFHDLRSERHPMTEHERVRALLLTGTVGSGKTAVATEMGLLLEERELPSAIVDLDWLGWVHLGTAFEGVERLIAGNLAAIWPNLRSAGVRRLVLVRAIHRREAVDGLRRALPKADLTVVRLSTSRATAEERLRRRDTGPVLEEHLRQTVVMAALMDRAALEDFKVANDGRPIREVAAEILLRASWVHRTPGADGRMR